MKQRKVFGIIKCKECKIDFEARSYRAQCCSDKCRNAFNNKNKATLKICLHCNKEYRNYKESKFCSPNCQHDNKVVNNLEVKLFKNDMREIKKRMKKIESLFKSIEKKINRFRECKQCSCQFYKGINTNRRHYCSDKCYKRSARKDKDKRLTKNGKADYSITLEKLNYKDKGVCHICNEQTDYNDYVIDMNGNFIAGNNYPSIDHVIAIANGGLHQWDNVKLAHRLCNSIKQDK